MKGIKYEVNYYNLKKMFENRYKFVIKIERVNECIGHIRRVLWDRYNMV